jgi:hypothetical protein
MSRQDSAFIAVEEFSFGFPSSENKGGIIYGAAVLLAVIS